VPWPLTHTHTHTRARTRTHTRTHTHTHTHTHARTHTRARTHARARAHTHIVYLLLIFTPQFLMSIVKTFVTVAVQCINRKFEISHCLTIVILLSLCMLILWFYHETGYDCFKISSLLEIDTFLG
jgi:hypothetical protein